MAARLRLRYLSYCVFLVLLVAKDVDAFNAAVQTRPAAVQTRPNATIQKGNVNLRESYPTFALTTLVKFRLEPGKSVAVLPPGARVEITAKRIVGGYEWFEATYKSKGRNLKGWVYAGAVGKRTYLRFDAGAEARVPVLASGNGARRTDELSLLLLVQVPTLQAQQLAVVEPTVRTQTFPTLLVSAAYVLVFILGLIAIKRWVFKDSNTYVLVSGLLLMLILGTMSEPVVERLFGSVLPRAALAKSAGVQPPSNMASTSNMASGDTTAGTDTAVTGASK